MSDPQITPPAFPANDSDEPRSWLRQMWQQAQVRWNGSSEVIALREAIEELIEETTTENGAPNAERTLLANIVKFRALEAGDCMVPRADIIAVDVASDLKQLVAVMAESTHSRIPVYRGTLDEALGMIHMKDVMVCMAHQRECAINDLLRPVLFVPPSMPASRLLLQMRQTRQHMAMVVDEFGGIDGMVTIEDLVEQVVGEIEDEHDDPATPDVIVRSDGSLLAEGRLTIEDFEARVGPRLTDAERETIDTLGGYVFHLAGHVPQIGETVKGADGLSFEVLETDQNRIKRVRVHGLPRPQHAEKKQAQAG